MPDIRLIQFKDLQLNVNVPPPNAPTQAVQKSTWSERNTDANIPAGAYYVEVRNEDISGTISVNGNLLEYGDTFHREVKFDRVNNVYDLCEGVNVISSGKTYAFSVAYPSSSPVDPTVI